MTIISTTVAGIPQKKWSSPHSQLPSHVQLFATPWTAARQASLSYTISWSLPKFMSIALVMPSNHLILCCPLLLLPSIFTSIRVFSNESALHIRESKYWSFSFSISPSNEYSGLISLKIDWFDLLAVQGTFRSLLQHHSLKASILWHSAFFTVQFSPLYVITDNLSFVLVLFYQYFLLQMSLVYIIARLPLSAFSLAACRSPFFILGDHTVQEWGCGNVLVPLYSAFECLFLL